MAQKISKILSLSDQDRIFFGVCGGIAKHFNWDAWMVRTVFIVGVLAFGLAPILYLIFAFSFSSEEAARNRIDEKKVLGVCARLAHRMDWDVSIVRSVFASSLLLSLIPSFGTTLLIYVALYFVVPFHKYPLKGETIDVQGRRRH